MNRKNQFQWLKPTINHKQRWYIISSNSHPIGTLSKQDSDIFNRKISPCSTHDYSLVNDVPQF